MPMTPPSTYAIESFTGYLLNVKAKNTAIKYTDAARHFLTFCEEKKLPFDRLPVNALGDFVTWLLARDLAPRSVHVYVAGARSYLKWCEGHGLATPVRLHADMPKAAQPVPNALRDEALLAYLRASSKLHEPYRTALLLLPYCGLRSEELASLPLSAVRKVALPLRGTDTHKDHIVFVVRGKGGHVRIVPLLLDGGPIFLAYLKSWRQHVTEPQWLFPGGPSGHHIATRTIRHYVQEIRKTVPTPNRLTPHALRDTYATTLWKCGIDIPMLTKIIGHKSVQTTYNHYLDIQQDDVVGAIVSKDARLVMQSPASKASASLQDYLRADARASRVPPEKPPEKPPSA